MAEIVTVRIPNLTEQIGIGLNDRFPLWVESLDKTKQTTLGQLRSFILEGFTGSQPPVYDGGSLFVIVPAELDGQTVLPVAQLAGLTYKPKRAVIGGMNPGTYEILDAGGIKLISEGDVLRAGELFEFQVFEYQTNPGAASGSLISGVLPISTNYDLAPDSLDKLIQLRGFNNSITATLPDVEDIPENKLIIIESLINNTKQNIIDTQESQNFYYNNTSFKQIYLAPGEVVWLVALPDGFYVLNFIGNLFSVGEINAKYKGGLNEVLCDGRLLKRADYPRLYEFAVSLSGSYLQESVWQTASVTVDGITVPFPYRGCFSNGVVGDDFRIPDLRGSALRGLKAGSDPSRASNIAGNFQPGRVGPHRHFIAYKNSTPTAGADLTGLNFLQIYTGNSAGVGNANYEYNLRGIDQEPNAAMTGREGTNNYGNVMDNIGVNWYIKV